MAIFEPAYDYMIRNEVKKYGFPDAVWYTNIPGDAGGPTAWGVTIATARRHGYMGAMDKMKESEAIEVYRKGFWRYEGVDNQRVATKIFDMGVNMGGQRAHLILQKALRPGDLGFVDGRWGPATLGAVNAANPDELLKALAEGSRDFYTGLAERNPVNQKFLKGWLNRAGRLPR
jgi:lysozyme family protein